MKLPNSGDIGHDGVPTRHSMLVRLADAEDNTTWSSFYQLYRPLVLGFAMKLSLSRDEADEVCQEVFTEVSDKISSFDYDRGKGSFRGWLFQRVRWRVLDKMRKRKQLSQNLTFPDDPMTGTPLVERVPGSSDLEQLWEQESVRSRLDFALQRLSKTVPAKKYQAFELHTVQEWPADKVARSLGMNVAAVYMNSHRLKKQLKKELDRLSD